MWLTTQWKLRRALRRYGRDGDVDAVLGADWSRSREIFAFFREIVDRLHGEEITRLRQKQAEYLALQNQINPHFLYNALEAIRSDALLADCADIAETTEALATFFRYTNQMYRNMSHFRMNWTMRKTISPSSAAASATNSKWSLKWKMKICLRRECRSSFSSHS